MVTNKQRLATFFIAGLLGLLLPNQASAQENYQEEAGGLSTLYRGKTQNLYPYRFNGTYFLTTRSFSRGDVLYNGKLYRNVLLNLDASAMELVAKPKEESGGVILYRNQVAWFTLGERRFVNLRYLGYPEAEEGYFEVLRDGPKPLLRLARKTLKVDKEGNAGVALADIMDGNYDAGVANYFGLESKTFLLENGQLKKLSRRALRQRLKQAPETGESPLDTRPQQWHPDGTTLIGAVPEAVFNARGIGLPEHYFEPERVDTTVLNYVENARTATFRNKVYPIGEGGASRSGRATVSGTVFEAESGEPLPGVVIYDGNTSTYVRSDATGRYRISLPVGDNILNFNAESKEDLSLKIILSGDGTLDIVMTEKVTLLKGAIISASSMEKHHTTAMGVETVTMKTAGKIPSAFGEGDIIKAVLTLPGVKSVGEASGGFNVRGGSADQNLILYNDNTLYNPNHLFGMFSAFHPDLVEDVQLYKSSIPAEFGGRISSVMSVKSREGDPEKLKGSLGIGLLTSRFHLEGPLSKGKTTFIAGGRISYSDWMLGMLPKNSAYAGGKAGFGDANLGLTHRFDSRNSLHLSAYYASDRFSFSGDTTFRYRNLNASVSFRHKDDNDGLFKVSLGYDQYANRLEVHDWAEGAFDLQTYIRQAFLKAGRTRPVGAHTLSYGLDALGYALDPGIMNPAGEASLIRPATLNREYGLEPALYLSDNWQLTEQFSVDGGLRVSSFLALNPTTFYAGPEFRLSAKYSPEQNLSFKAGFNTMRQYIHLISNTSSVSPMDSWRLSSAEIAPTTGWQGAAGAYWTLLGAGVDLSLEGYYKRSRNALDYKSGALLSMNPDLPEALVPVYGRAYGVELMARKPAGSLTGWISYTYSRSQLREMGDRGDETINGGAWYNAPYDKPHEFKLTGNYAFTHRFSLSLNVDYSTGRPITVPIGKYYYGGAWRLAYSERNSHRIPDYFRVDAAFNIDPGHYLKAIAHTSITIGIYNITGRKNPYSVFFRTNPSGEIKGYMLSVFATQIPYINLNILF